MQRHIRTIGHSLSLNGMPSVFFVYMNMTVGGVLASGAATVDAVIAARLLFGTSFSTMTHTMVAKRVNCKPAVCMRFQNFRFVCVWVKINALRKLTC